jgi:predicted transcriptional regulator
MRPFPSPTSDTQATDQRQAMDDRSQQAGISEVLIARFEHQRLPRLLTMRERLNAGEALTEADLDFLDRVLADAMSNRHLVDSIPQCKDLFARVVHLYHEITAKALDNESSR